MWVEKGGLFGLPSVLKKKKGLIFDLVFEKKKGLG